MLLHWCAAMLASYCWTAEPVHTFIKNEISKYFDRWRIEDTGKYFPYAMNKKKYTGYREGEGKVEWDKLEKKLKQHEKDFKKTQKTARYILHEGEYCEVNNDGYYEIQKD
jgi:hypothetical protein